MTVDGLAPVEVSERLAARGVVAPAGSFYALEASRHAGLGDAGRCARSGSSAYTTADEVDRLLAALDGVARHVTYVSARVLSRWLPTSSPGCARMPSCGA